MPHAKKSRLAVKAYGTRAKALRRGAGVGFKAKALPYPRRGSSARWVVAPSRFTR